MNTITQTMRFRQVLIEYSLKNGVTKAAIRYKETVNIFIGGKKDMTELYSL